MIFRAFPAISCEKWLQVQPRVPYSFSFLMESEAPRGLDKVWGILIPQTANLSEITCLGLAIGCPAGAFAIRIEK